MPTRSYLPTRSTACPGRSVGTDGYRLIARGKNGVVHLWSRTGRNWDVCDILARQRTSDERKMKTGTKSCREPPNAVATGGNPGRGHRRLLGDDGAGRGANGRHAGARQAIIAAKVTSHDGRVVRWRSVDLQRLIAERYGVTYHERTVGEAAMPRFGRTVQSVLRALRIQEHELSYGSRTRLQNPALRPCAVFSLAR